MVTERERELTRLVYGIAGRAIREAAAVVGEVFGAELSVAERDEVAERLDFMAVQMEVASKGGA